MPFPVTCVADVKVTQFDSGSTCAPQVHPVSVVTLIDALPPVAPILALVWLSASGQSAGADRITPKSSTSAGGDPPPETSAPLIWVVPCMKAAFSTTLIGG